MTYVNDLENAIKHIRKLTVRGDLLLPDRIDVIREVSDRYALKHAEMNDVSRMVAKENGREAPFNPTDTRLLSQLSDLLLHEDLTDTTAWKSRQSEYPFLSELQFARRRDGVHQRKNEGGSGEVSFEQTETVANDGRDYRVPVRRKRSYTENLLVDLNARSRNKERQKAYESFVAVQPVITYKVTKM